MEKILPVSIITYILVSAAAWSWLWNFLEIQIRQEERDQRRVESHQRRKTSPAYNHRGTP